MIACDCEVCSSSDPRDQRTRPSIFVQLGDAHLLIDTTPELRLQCLANDIRRVTAVLYTHHHADHVVGLDDLRRFNWIQESAISCYAQAEDLEVITRMFVYAFEDDPDYPSHKPDLQFIPIEGPLKIPAGGTDQRQASHLTVIPIPLLHGSLPVLGYRIGDFAYCTDCSFIPDSSAELLTGLDVLVLGAPRRRPHPTHFNLEQATDQARRLGAKRTYFTHIAHELLHARTNAELPEGVALGYDGQVIEL